MLRIIMVLTIGLTGASCSSFYSDYALDNFDQTYLFATQTRRGMCYTRIQQGQPVDQICQRGDFIRYSSDPVLKKKLDPVPAYIIALFQAIRETQPRQAAVPALGYVAAETLILDREDNAIQSVYSRR